MNCGSNFKIVHIKVLAVLNPTRLKHGYSLADWIYWLSLRVKSMRALLIVQDLILCDGGIPQN